MTATTKRIETENEKVERILKESLPNESLLVLTGKECIEFDSLLTSNFYSIPKGDAKQ